VSQTVRLGVCLPNFPFGEPPSREAIVEVALEAESLGYDSVWATDHLLVPSDMPRFGRVFESVSTLAYLGGITSRVRLGTSVLIVALRNAVEVAKQSATIDALTGGRLVLGVAAGYAEREFAAVGASFHDRGSHLDEAIGVMRTLWTQPDPRADGPRYRFAEVLFEPRPDRPGGMPVWVGGNSGAAIARAARLGDAWHPDGLSSAQVADGVARLRAATPPGRHVGVSLRRTLDLRPGAGPGGGTTGSGEVPLRGIDEVRAELRALGDLGVGHVVCQFEHSTLAEHLDQLRALAGEFALDPSVP
jgi:probable F420-dependent oxidoreductase